MPLRSLARQHLYELVRECAREFPWAVTLGGQEGMVWEDAQ